jgi:hypothetical protein
MEAWSVELGAWRMSQMSQVSQMSQNKRAEGKEKRAWGDRQKYGHNFNSKVK